MSPFKWACTEISAHLQHGYMMYLKLIFKRRELKHIFDQGRPFLKRYSIRRKLGKEEANIDTEQI